jgi:hypothetical protein
VPPERIDAQHDRLDLFRTRRVIERIDHIFGGGVRIVVQQATGTRAGGDRADRAHQRDHVASGARPLVVVAVLLQRHQLARAGALRDVVHGLGAVAQLVDQPFLVGALRLERRGVDQLTQLGGGDLALAGHVVDELPVEPVDQLLQVLARRVR